MALTGRQQQALAGAALVATVVPVLALFPYPLTPRAADDTESRAITPRPVAAISAIYERDLFTPASDDGPPPADAPALVGIAGRLNRDAVALVRLADGSSRSLKLGESVEGWRLESLAIDAAFFTRGRERVRVAMQSENALPAAEPDQ